jgi:hypothetical protein
MHQGCLIQMLTDLIRQQSSPIGIEYGGVQFKGERDLNIACA